MFGSTQNPQVIKAYRLVLRYLRTRQMKTGELLPAQPQLRQELGFGNDTLVKAMKWLMEDGVLERRQRVGTMVCDISKATLVDHKVVLAMVSHTKLANEPFYGNLMRSLDGYVGQILGAQMRIITQRDTESCLSKWPLESFTGLKELIDAGDVDAVICPIGTAVQDVQQVMSMGIPWLHVSSWEQPLCGVAIDPKPMLMEACQMLIERGCQRISLVNYRMRIPEQPRLWEGYSQASSELGFEMQPILVTGEISIDAGRRLAQRLLQMPLDQRPDGLMLIHDTVASGVTDVLRDQLAYRPQIAVHANVPGSVIFGIPVIRFDVDIYKLARQTVDLLQTLWKHPHDSANYQWYVPMMKHQCARDVQMSTML